MRMVYPRMWQDLLWYRNIGPNSIGQTLPQLVHKCRMNDKEYHSYIGEMFRLIQVIPQIKVSMLARNMYMLTGSCVVYCCYHQLATFTSILHFDIFRKLNHPNRSKLNNYLFDDSTQPWLWLTHCWIYYRQVWHLMNQNAMNNMHQVSHHQTWRNTNDAADCA